MGASCLPASSRRRLVECHPGPSHGFGEVIGIEHGERKALLEASGDRVVLVGGRELPDAKAGS